MWDNRAVLHRARPWLDDEPRHMVEYGPHDEVRTTITATDVDGLSEMWPSRAAA